MPLSRTHCEPWPRARREPVRAATRNGEAGDSTAAPSSSAVDSDGAGDSTAAPEPLGQRQALPTLTTADGAERFFEWVRVRRTSEAFGAEPDISTLANYPTSLLWFDTIADAARPDGPCGGKHDGRLFVFRVE